MADLFVLAPPETRVTGTTEQPLYLAREVLEYDELFLKTFFSGCRDSGGTLTVVVDTGMHLENTQGWITLYTDTFSAVLPGAYANHFLTKGTFLRYLRWRVTSYSVGASASFWIAGIARRYGSK
jgi:hypothetical protein